MSKGYVPTEGEVFILVIRTGYSQKSSQCPGAKFKLPRLLAPAKPALLTEAQDLVEVGQEDLNLPCTDERTLFQHNMMHHHIVGLEAIHIPYPDFQAPEPHTCRLSSYDTTSPEQLLERVRNATIIIATTVKITAEVLSVQNTPELKAIAVMAAGTDHVDINAAKSRGIVVFNCPHASSEVTATHAVSLYFAARRRTVMMHNLTREEPSEWKLKGSVAGYMRTVDGDAPLTPAEEVCGIVGYGAIGKRVADTMQALGMKVLIADRRDGKKPRQDRTPFTEVLRQSTVLVIVVPKTAETTNLISDQQLAAMQRLSVVINISRGGIVDEAAVVNALQKGTIAGYSTDVFAVEPAGGPADSPLLAKDTRDLNITLSPHVAWFGDRTRRNLVQMLRQNVEMYMAGTPQNVVL